MRIRRLDLRAFGHFRDRQVDLDGRDGVIHLIHGANEAGKSTALEAIHEFLFGFRVRSPHAFHIAMPKLRLGALLEDGDGEVHELWRLKKNKDSLRDAEERPVSESVLSKMLAGVDSELFRNFFGLDHERIHSGGEELLADGGDLGRVLFSSGSGLTGLPDVRQKLGEDAGKLFISRGKVQTIPVLLRDLKEKKKKIQELSTPSSDWERNRTALEGLEKEVESLGQEGQEILREKGRLERQRDSLRDFGRLRELREEIEQLPDTLRLREGLEEEYLDARKKLDRIEPKIEILTGKLEDLVSDRSRLEVPAEIAARCEEIERLHGLLSAIRRDRDELRDEEIALAGLRERGEAILTSLGLARAWEDVDALIPDLTTRQGIRRLSKQHHELTRQRREADEMLRKLESRLAELGTDLADTPVEEIGPFEVALKEARSAGDIEEQRENIVAESRRVRDRLERDLRGLPVEFDSLEELRETPILPLEEIQAFRDELEDLEKKLESRDEKIRELEDTLDGLNGELERHREEGSVPDPDELGAARDLRDQGWLAIRSRLDLDDEARSRELERHYLEAHGADLSLTGAFARDLDRTDDLADQLRSRAQEVTELARVKRERVEVEKKIEKARREREIVEARRVELREAWKAAWSRESLAKLSPRRAVDFAGRVRGILDGFPRLDACQEELEKIDLQERRLRKTLEDCSPAGRPATSTAELSWKSTLLAHEQHLETLQQARQERKDHESERGRLEIERRDLTKTLANLEGELESVQSLWEEALAPLELERRPAPDEFDEHLERLVSLEAIRKEERKGRGRRRGLQARLEDFEAEVEPLRSLLDSAPSDALTIIEKLHEAVAPLERWNDLGEQLEKQREELEAVRGERREVQATLARLAEEAGCESPEGLRERIDHWNERRALEVQLEEVEEWLREKAAGATLPDFLAELETIDGDVLGVRIQDLEERKSELDATRDEKNTELGRLQEKAKAFERQAAEAHVPLAVVEQQSLLARLRSEVDEYVRLRLAGVILDRGLERYRKLHEGPVLETARSHFERLTLGRYFSLEVEHAGSLESPRLRAVRRDPDGEPESVTVEGLSDGTRDQLYLSLRLAALDVYLERHGAFPVILDDILVHFDDERSAVALEILAELSERTQVIFFTHHAHLLDVARETLSESQLDAIQL